MEETCTAICKQLRLLDNGTVRYHGNTSLLIDETNRKIFILIFGFFLQCLLSTSIVHVLAGIRVQMFLVLALGRELVLLPAGFVMN
jgi:hypothetical protein